MENTSGQGQAAAVPPEIDRWNWGAFLLSWIWGIGNDTLIAPLANVVMPFVLGAKGSAWAWQNKKWESIEQFKKVQRQWAMWGAILWVFFIALFAAMFFAIIAVIKHTDAFRLAAATLEANEQVVQLVGKPMSLGIPSGKISESGPKGSASISFGVEGPKGKGTVHMEAAKDMGRWKIERMVLEEEGTGRRIDLAPQGSPQ